MFSFFKKKKTQTQSHGIPASGARTDQNTRIYAIGDIHGRADLLSQLLEKIFTDIQSKGDNKTNRLIFLGDYVDRGLQSKLVLDILTQSPPKNVHYTFIKGNHEDAMIDFLEDPANKNNWLQYGGIETLLSYNTSMKPGRLTAKEYSELGANFLEALPAAHLNFLKDLELHTTSGDYYFCHAGVNPNTPLSDQRPHDLMWVRDNFIHHTPLFEKVIVHGHTICPDVTFLPNRIAVDTGAYYSGHLSALVLEDEDKKVLQT